MCIFTLKNTIIKITLFHGSSYQDKVSNYIAIKDNINIVIVIVKYMDQDKSMLE
jgi:hypothetical protein